MIYYRYIAELLFVLFTLLVFTGGYIALTARYLMNAVLGLALALLGVAGLYFHLGSPFLALMQILIYVGAVCIIIAFGIMVGPRPNQLADKRAMGPRNVCLSIGACAAAAGLLGSLVVQTVWVPAAAKVGDMSVKFIGESLMYQYCLAFELISVLLLAAIVGAIIIAGIGREEPGKC
ncbi:NADH-quinone oxidoreductase subunit J [Geomonas sp. RF6]|uniref:NADH-quinone oxidoreductase subunit J n=1 Tax=Geomonas sp. RF6 TaxID=2897342 RepID=UPI001E32E3E4|nr:NADH-quinone oxidoreductase subunit J [Geomonas sp. RF6]UFS69795.1 NADH-quinone oxidoreductase subunit J [Geomonas sp. RF6]